MNTKNPIFDISNWKYLDTQLTFKKLEKMTPRKFGIVWVNDGNISPLDLYCYLKARFGDPNGVTMLARQNSTDNPIQWHYTLFSDDSDINIFGMNIHLEIMVSSNRPIFEKDWKTFIKIVKDDFKKFGPKMTKVRKSLERWSIFNNPYKRLNMVVETLVERLKELDLQKLKPLPSVTITEKQQKEYSKKVEKWQKNIHEAKFISTSLKMIAPVFGESFINMIIFILAKQKVKSDSRLYEDLIRKQIDVRVKSLPLYCDGFIKDIESDAEEFKKFLTLMNSRNDFLHGNVNPIKLKFDEVFFDKTIPLFKDEQSLVIHLIENSLHNIEPDTALNDIEVVRDFVDFMLGHLDPVVRIEVEGLLFEYQLGWKEDTKRIGILFSWPIPEFTMIINNNK